MKISEKTQMRLIVGALMVTAAGMTTFALIMLPKLKAQEKQISELIKK